MIKGIGVDIVEIRRFQEIVTSQPKFVERYFTKDESTNVSIQSLAGKFAAKEAFVKATKGLISGDLKDIQVLKLENGAPFFLLTNEFHYLSVEFEAHLSISHDAGTAIAFVVIAKRLK
ncbi:MAG: holo-[acyl-carrier-protein] synthase [Actinobacteria bacterium]|nr:holo-[acyl-carrier-protein] synthase [Actinomycetota bacterium]